MQAIFHDRSIVTCFILSKKPQDFPARIMRDVDGETKPEHAPFSINGAINVPESQGRIAVRFWCYSLEDALAGARWCAENNYTHVSIWGWNKGGEDTGMIFAYGAD